MSSVQPLHLPEFMTGIFAALAHKQISSLTLRQSRLDLAFDRLNQEMIKNAEQHGIDVKFRMRVHPVHEDSPVLHQALYEAAQRDLISLDNPEFQRIRLKIDSADALGYLDGLPGGVDMYLQLADQLLCYYQELAEEPVPE